MIILLQLLVIGVFALVAATLWTGARNKRVVDGSSAAPPGEGPVIEGSVIEGSVIEGRAVEARSPAGRAAALLAAFEHARGELRGEYPATFAMLGGYLNAHTINAAGGLEGAVKEMITDWTPRAEEVTKELTRLLAENETEDEVRAIVLSACDATFEDEGYRKWMIWLLGRFNAV